MTSPASPAPLVIPDDDSPMLHQQSPLSPPTPTTPNTRIPADAPTQIPEQQPPASAEHAAKQLDMSHAEHRNTASPARDSRSFVSVTPGELDVLDISNPNAVRDLKCLTPSDMLPPSPPLTATDADARAGDDQSNDTAVPTAAARPTHMTLDTGAGMDADQGAHPLSHLREEDITSWRASLDPHQNDFEGTSRIEHNNEGVTGDEDEEEEVFMYSTEVSPVDPRPNLDHPLNLDVTAPSPPLWEVIQPSGPNVNLNANGGVASEGTAASSRRVHQFGKAVTSRPLIPRSSYYFGPPPLDAAYHTEPVGQIGVHHPREIVRVERDYTGGELVQFSPTYPLELEGRVTPTQFMETINEINELLISAHSLKHAFVDNALAFLTLQISKLVMRSHYDKEMQRLKQFISDVNARVYNPAGLNILWPRDVAFMFLEIEYY